MTEPLDWAPYASDGEEYRRLPPIGITYCLSTYDIPGAVAKPAIRKFLHPEVGDKMIPALWFSGDPQPKFKAARALQSRRVLNPLDPDYKLPLGPNLIPCGENKIFSKRVTDFMGTSDIPGSMPGPLYKRPMREKYHLEDPGSHPAKKTHVRTRVTIGQGLDLFDINIGKRQFGFTRSIISNPLEPVYPNEPLETPTQKYARLKRRVLPEHGSSKVNAMEKLLDKLYWKVEDLQQTCKKSDILERNEVTTRQFRNNLKKFGVKFSDEEFSGILAIIDKENSGFIKYNCFPSSLRKSKQ